VQKEASDGKGEVSRSNQLSTLGRGSDMTQRREIWTRSQVIDKCIMSKA
jgi:hypothetical protein